jgi:hypothetical protein
MPYFNVALVGAARVWPTAQLVEIIRGVLEPLTEQAGKTLNLWTPPDATGATRAELALNFSSRSADPVELRFGEQFIRPGPIGLILGIEGGAEILVGALEELRVGVPRRGRHDHDQPATGRFREPGIIGREVRRGNLERDYFTSARSVFTNGEPEFARFAANVALHETGHIVAALPHSTDMFNYMATGGAMPEGDWRNWENVRRFWSGRKTFNEAQSTQIIEHIASGSFAGGGVIS